MGVEAMAVDKNKGVATVKEDEGGHPSRSTSPTLQPRGDEITQKDNRSASPPLKARHSSRKGNSISWAEYEGVIKGRADEKMDDAYNAPRALSRDASRRPSRRSTPEVQSSYRRSTSPELLPVSRWSSASPASGRSSRANSPSPPSGSSPSLNSPPSTSPKGSPARGIYSTSTSSPGSPTGILTRSSRSNLSPLSPLSRSPSPPDGHGSRAASPSSDQRPSLRLGRLLTNTPSCNCDFGDPKCEHGSKNPPRATSFVTLLPDVELVSSPKQAASKTEPNRNTVHTPRVPGDETKKSSETKPRNHSKVTGLLAKEALLLKVPGYLLKAQAAALGTSGRTSPEPQESPFVKNGRFSRASLDFHVPTTVRPRSSVELSKVGIGRPRNSVAEIIMRGTDVRNRGSIDGSTKQTRRETVTIPISAKQWLLQSIGLKDQQIRAMFGQMEAVPSSAADHVREIRAEWDALEARDQRVSPSAEFLMKDQALLQQVKELLHRFNDRPHPLPQDVTDDRKTSFEQAEELLSSLLTEGHMPILVSPLQGSQDHKVAKVTEDRNSETTLSPPSAPPPTLPSSAPGLQPRRSVSPGGGIVGRFMCQNCGEITAAATPHSNVSRTGPLPKETVLQRSPSAFPNLAVPSGDSIPSLIPVDDYVVQKAMFKPDNDYKSAFSPMDKRWYSVLFPALQPGKREDVELLGAWLQHATQRNCTETPDGRFEDVESAFVLHCIAFLEIVRQVRIHCEDRGNLLLHLWRQLLRVFNQVMVLVEPRLTAAEEELRQNKEHMAIEKATFEHSHNEIQMLKAKLASVEQIVKVQTYELSKIHRCRLCLAENMTPRSRDELIRRAKGKSFASISENIGDGEKEAREAVLHLGYKQIQAAKESIAEQERAAEKVRKASRKQDPTKKKEMDKPPVPTSTTADAKDGRHLKDSGWQKVKKMLMDALVGSDEELPLSARLSHDRGDSDSSGSVYADVHDQSDQESGEDEDTDGDEYEEDEEDEKAGSTELSGGTGESRLTSYAQSLDFEASADLEERIAYLLGLPEAGTQTEENELKERHGFAKRPKSAPGRLQTVYPKVKKVSRQNKFDEFAADLLPTLETEGDGDATKGDLDKYGALAEDTIFLLERTLPVVDGIISTDIQRLLHRYREITRKHAADGGLEEEFIGRRGSSQRIVEEGEGGEVVGGEQGGKGRKASKRVSRRSRDGFRSPTATSRSNSLQQMTDSRRSSDTKGATAKTPTPVPLGFAHLMNIKVSPKNTRSMNVRQLTRLISQIYAAKIEADIIDDASNLDRQTCCEFIYDHMLHQYGLKKLSEAAIHGMFKTIKSLIASRQIDKAHRIRLFSRFVGFDGKVMYGERDLYLYLQTLSRAQSKVGTIFSTEQEDGQSFINCALLHNFTDEPSLVERLKGSENANIFIEKFANANAVKERCSPEVKKVVKLSEVRKLDWDLLLEAILDTKDQQEEGQEAKKLSKRRATRVSLPKDKRQELETLFIAGDVSQEGLLTFNDFLDIVSAGNPSIKSQIATRMYRETLVLMGGGDRISPSAFATIAHTRGITVSPDIIHMVLRRTWAKVQPRVNVNLLKDEEVKAEFEEVRSALMQMIEARRDLNAAVQIFRGFVLKFCKKPEPEPEPAPEPADEEEPQDEQIFNFDD